MEALTIALFGEAEKGLYNKGYLCQDLTELMDVFGNPPPESLGLYYATQALLYHYPLLYFRVGEEGFSVEDYLRSIKVLSESPMINKIGAICTPGVGDHAIIESLLQLCHAYHQVLIATERDFFDYCLSQPGGLR